MTSLKNSNSEKDKDLKEIEQLIKKSTLSEKDAEELANKINEAMGRHAEALLKEIHARR